MNNLLQNFMKVFVIGGILLIIYNFSPFYIYGQDLQNPIPENNSQNTESDDLPRCYMVNRDTNHSTKYGDWQLTCENTDPSLPWFKLKNASLHKNQFDGLRATNLPVDDGSIIFVPLPSNSEKYDDSTDDDDWRQKKFIGGTGAGVATFEGAAEVRPGGVNLGYVGTGNNCANPGTLDADRCISSNNWRTFEYTPQKVINIDKFLEYTQARKNYVITKVNDIQAGKINILDTGSTSGPQSVIEITSGSTDLSTNKLNEGDLVSKGPLVLIVKGNVYINTTNSTYDSTYRVPTVHFNNGKVSIAILATGSIGFSEAISEANGIFMAHSMNTGGSGNNTFGLKIKGNVITDELTISRNREQQRNNRKASLFIIFDPKIYIELLPYLSTTSYDWRTSQ